MKLFAFALVSVLALGCGGKAPASTPSNSGGAATKTEAAGPTCTEAQVAVNGACQKRCSDDAECGAGHKCVEVDGEMKREQAEDGSFSGPVLESEKYCTP